MLQSTRSAVAAVQKTAISRSWVRSRGLLSRHADPSGSATIASTGRQCFFSSSPSAPDSIPRVVVGPVQSSLENHLGVTSTATTTTTMTTTIPSTSREWGSGRRQSSSLATALVSSEEEDEEDVNLEREAFSTRERRATLITPVKVSVLSAQSSSVDRDRPRLDSLRQRLREESLVPTGNASSQPTLLSNTKTTSATPVVEQTISSAPLRPSAAETTAPSVWPPSQAETVATLRALIDTLPHPVEESTVLTDRFGRRHSYLRLSLTERCNLRCTYCMPEAGVPLQPAEHLLQTDELLELARYFARHGVTKFRLTGGEPTLRKDIVEIVHGLQELRPQQIGMTTNGIVLPTKLRPLVEAGLTSVNISLDTLHPEKFAKLTRRPGSYLRKVWESLELSEELLEGKGQTKLNCVVMRGINTDEIADFVRLTNDFPNLAVRFIEYMPFTENGWNLEQLVPYKELIEEMESNPANSDIQLQPVPSRDPSDTTKWYRTAAGGNVGFITSMSSHFCGTCNRLRLTADGQLKVCLFDGITELSLRDALRAGFSQADVSKLVNAAVQKKRFSLGGHPDPSSLAKDVANNRPMTLIGG